MPDRDSAFDTSLGALTPEGIEFVLFPAGLPVRTAAYGIDKIIQWCVLLAIVIAAKVFDGAGGSWLMLILNFCVDWFYHVICELMFRGQSPGKRIMGIRVVRSDGAPVDPSSSFLRNLLRFADTFFFFFPIALVSIAASPGFRRLGDWAGGTLVVYTPRVSGFASGLERRERNSWISRLAPIAPPLPLSHEEKKAILMFARRYPLLGELRAGEIGRSFARFLREGDGIAHNELSDAAYLLGLARFLSGEAVPAPQHADPSSANDLLRSYS
jgi:uncharacterized RDD family membrane protein YckC